MTVSMSKPQTETAVFVLDHENEQHRAIRAGINRASWTTAKGLSPAERETLRAVVRGERVMVSDVVAAIVSGLSANATRFGQSMARRSGRQPLLDLYNLLPSTSTVSPVEAEHRARVEQAQAAEITRLRNEGNTLRQQRMTLQREVEALRYNLAAVRPQAADVAASDFAYSLLTPEQRQRVSDFRTGFRAAEGR